MAKFKGTFERKETKFVLNACQVAELKRRISSRMQLDAYGRTRIDSLYFDTPNRDIISRSLEKPTYKEKLRVRAYGDAALDSAVFVEIKKKFKGIVYKRRVCMSRAGAQAYLKGMEYCQAQRAYPINGLFDEESISGQNMQIAHELDAFMQRYSELQPSMVISCMREAWKAIDENDPECDVRITFDEDISYVDMMGKRFDYEAALAAEGKDFALTGGNAVLEVKCAGAFPLWLVGDLRACGIKPQSFSKYGTAYQICCARRPARVGRRVASEKAAVHAPVNVSFPRRIVAAFGLFGTRKAVRGISQGQGAISHRGLFAH